MSVSVSANYVYVYVYVSVSFKFESCNYVSSLGPWPVLLVMSILVASFHKRPLVFERLGGWLHLQRPLLARLIFVYFASVF